MSSLVNLARLVLTASEAIDSSKIVHAPHRWGSMRFANNPNPQKSYRVNAKIQAFDRSTFVGDMSISEGKTMVGINGDLNSQQVPSQLLVSTLPPVGSTPMWPQASIEFLFPPKSATKAQSTPKILGLSLARSHQTRYLRSELKQIFFLRVSHLMIVIYLSWGSTHSFL